MRILTQPRVFCAVGVRVAAVVGAVGLWVPSPCEGQSWRNPSPPGTPAWANARAARMVEVPRPAAISRPEPGRTEVLANGGTPDRRLGTGRVAVSQIVRMADAYSKKGIRYVFGSTDPRRGLDCSATVQQVLMAVGVRDVPRNSQAQYEWLARAGTLGRQRSEAKILSQLRPGQLLFWGGTYRTGNKVSHVMIYLGRDPRTGRRYMFGGRSASTRGLNGANVDVYEIEGLHGSGRFVGYGNVPGVTY